MFADIEHLCVNFTALIHRQELGNNDWHKSVHHKLEHILSRLLLKVVCNDRHHHTTRNVVKLDHVVKHIVDLFTGQAFLDLGETALQSIQTHVIDDELGVAVRLVVDKEAVWSLLSNKLLNIGEVDLVTCVVLNIFGDFHILVKSCDINLLNSELVRWDVSLVVWCLSYFDRLKNTIL